MLLLTRDMAANRVLILFIAICVSHGALARKLQAQSPDAANECTPTWSATLDLTLANTLESGAETWAAIVKEMHVRKE